MELATLTPQFQAVLVLISMVDSSQGVWAHTQNAPCWQMFKAELKIICVEFWNFSISIKNYIVT